MRGSRRFTQSVRSDGSVFVFHGRNVSHLTAWIAEDGQPMVKVTMNSGQSVDLTGPLKEVMTEIYGRSIRAVVVKRLISVAGSLRKTWQQRG